MLPQVWCEPWLLRIAPGPCSRLHALDLAGDDVERLVPADALVARLAAVLRIALAVRVEIDALHRVSRRSLRIDDRLDASPAGEVVLRGGVKLCRGP